MVSTEEIMEIALELAGFKSIPSDSAVYVQGKNIKRVLFGIDADVPELLIAKRMGYDAVISHHPKGGLAIVDYHQVFSRHIQLMTDAGVPEDEARKAVCRKLASLEVEMHARNYAHAVDMAKILKMPYMNIHTPLDELGRRKMARIVSHETKREATIGDVVSALEGIPEFAKATTDIKIRIGKAADPAGKTVVSHGAGTNGGYEVAKAYFEHGVDTLIYIHISPSDLEKLRYDASGNLIITGHIASDSIGINPLIAKMEAEGILVTRLGIIPP